MSFRDKKSESAKPFHVFARFMARKLRYLRGVTRLHIFLHPSEKTNEPAQPTKGTLSLHIFDQNATNVLAKDADTLRMSCVANLTDLSLQSAAEISCCLQGDDHDASYVLQRILSFVHGLATAAKSNLELLKWGAVRGDSTSMLSTLARINAPKTLQNALKTSVDVIEALANNKGAILGYDGSTIQLTQVVKRPLTEQDLRQVSHLPAHYLVILNHGDHFETHLSWKRSSVVTKNKMVVIVHCKLIQSTSHKLPEAV